MKATVESGLKAATALFAIGFALAGCGVDLSFLDKDAGVTDGGIAACQSAEDCENLPHIECEGTWACADNTCVFNCTPPDEKCLGDADCPEGFHCEWPMPDTWEGDEPVAGGAEAKCAGLKCIPPQDGICVRDGECACYEIYDPVCGTDGMTYANDCFASCEGVGIAHWGECGIGCFEDGDCGPGFRCDFSQPCAVDVDEGGNETDPSDDSGSGGGMPACTGECVPVEQCRTDKDCLLVGGAPACDGTAECISGQCVWQCNETCFEDAECREGMRCVIDACPDCCPACDCDGRCFGHCAPVGGCYSDYDCAPGDECLFMPCDCVDEDGDGVVEDCYETCKQAGGFCQPRPTCAWDYDCGPGEKCVIDTCPSCPPDAVCIDSECWGHCEPANVECYSNADCRPGEVCDATAYADMTGCCIPLDDGTGCPADYPMCPGVCRPAVCPAVACLMDCEYGFKVGRDGCELCECNEPGTCETFNDPSGQVCTRCFNPDGSVTMSCGQPVCAMDQPACSSDLDCKGGAAGICVSGCCVFPGTCIETFAACKDDNMCPAGTACFDGACCYGLD